jgi:hypothetical protein
MEMNIGEHVVRDLVYDYEDARFESWFWEKANGEPLGLKALCNAYTCIYGMIPGTGRLN